MIFTIAFKKEIPEDSSIVKVVADKSVQIWTQSPYYHTEIFYDSIWYGIDAQGIHKYKLRELSEDYDYIEIDIDVTEQQLELIDNFFEKDFIYDWKGIIFSQFFPIGLNSREKWFCSEYVTKILQILLVPEVLYMFPHMVHPGKLYDLIKSYKEL